MKIDETKIDNTPVKKEKKPLDKNIIILISLVVGFLLVIAFIFNLEDDNQVQIKEQPKQEMNINAVKENQTKDKKQLRPDLIDVVSDKKDYGETQFDTNKIQELEAVKPDIKNDSLENPNLKTEIDELKKRIAELEKENLYLKYSQDKLQNKSQAQELHQEQKKDQEQTIKDEMKKYLTSIKKSINIKDNYFSFDGKNYYIGDNLKNYKIKDIRKNHIRFCNSNWCYTLRNYK
jgi:DNA repair exonuclease SbcCD ATPase subunit